MFGGSGHLLGSGVLGPTSDTASPCHCRAEPVTGKHAGDGIYRVTSRNESHGFLNYDARDVVDGGLLVIAELG